MKCLVLHESGSRIRIRVPIINMSYRQADLLEYYIKNIPRVKDVPVDERTGNATIYFNDRWNGNANVLKEALADYDENSEQVIALVPEETGRPLNRE